MPRLPVRCMLFFSSYFPLALIFSILFFRKNFWLALGILLFSGICLLGTVIYILSRSKTGGPSQSRITEVQRRDENVMSYIATYLIPFVTFQLDSPEQTLALIVFVLVLLVIFDLFVRVCENDARKKQKLINIARQPYLDTITIGDMRKVISDHKLKILVATVNNQEMLQYDPDDKWALLNLLEDNYLKSLMTGYRYEADGKRGV